LGCGVKKLEMQEGKKRGMQVKETGGRTEHYQKKDKAGTNRSKKKDWKREQ